MYALDGKFQGVGSRAVKSRGVETKEEDKCPVLRQHCKFFH